jgi:uncharacterized protein GlcG (DUF336 family)
MRIEAEQATRLIEAAAAKAADIGIAASIAVLDEAGHLKAFLRMDGAWLGSVDVAMKKARTSVLFEADTQSIWDVCKPEGQAHGLEATNGGLVTFGGGIPLKEADGRLIGAIGVSGGQVALDLEVARAGVAALVPPARDHSATGSKRGASQ